MGLSLKVGNADAGAFFNNEVLEVCDFAVRPYLSSHHSLVFIWLTLFDLRLDGQRASMVRDGQYYGCRSLDMGLFPGE